MSATYDAHQSWLGVKPPFTYEGFEMKRNLLGLTVVGVGAALIGPGSVALARGGDNDPGRVLQEAQERAERKTPVIDAMRRVRHDAGFGGAAALPSRFAGHSILDPSDNPAQRTATEAHFLTYGFTDGADLVYYSDFDEDFASVSVWETGPDGVSGTSLYGSIYEGPYASTSMGFFESSQVGSSYVSAGTSLWRSSWDEGEASPTTSALVTQYESDYGPEGWSYAGVDHHYQDFSRVTYSGGGTVSDDGAATSYDGISVIEGSEGRVQECVSTGNSLSEYGDAYVVSSDYADECEQFVEPYHYYSSWNHTEYAWNYTTYVSSYSFSGSVACTDEVGTERQYIVDYDEASWSYRYLDVDTGDEVGQMACAWDPWGAGFQD